jgi:phytoene dehydrogenase-like protein
MAQSADVIVVGAGHNGLTAACYLAKAGLDVLVVEGSPTVGGMTSTNPTIPGAPDHLVNEGAIEASLILISSIARDLQLERHGLKRLHIEVPHVQAGPDGSSIAIWKDARRTADEIRRYSPHDADAWLELARTLDTAMDVMLPYMLTHPTRPNLRNLLSAASGAVRHPRQLAPLGRFLTASLAEVIDERFEHPLTRGVLASVAPFSWVTQDSTGWALIYLGLIQRISPARFEGGTGALPAALHRCLLAHGGKVRTSALVDELVVRSGQVCGVRLANGEEIDARAVIASCSPKTTLTRLLPDGVLPEHLAKRARHIPTATAEGGHLKINVALRGRLSVPRHEKVRGDGLDLRGPLLTWSTLEDCIAGWEAVVARKWPERIPVMCTVPTAIDPTQGPKGQDTFWLWSGIVPVRPHETWETARDRIAGQVLADCATYYEGLDSLEIGRTVLSTPDLEERFHAIDGNVYHVDSVLQRFGPLRPAAGFGSYATPVPGLFLSGAGTHPTGGICGVPGQLAARVVMRSLKSGGLARRVAELPGRRQGAVAAPAANGAARAAANGGAERHDTPVPVGSGSHHDHNGG